MSLYDIYVNKATKAKKDQTVVEPTPSVTQNDIVAGMEAFPAVDLNIKFMKFGVEEDSPFSDIGEGEDWNLGSDDSDDDGDVFADSDSDNLFESNDDFGSSGGGSVDIEKEEVAVIDRIESVKNKFDMSKVIRKNFPNNIKSLLEISESCINIMERKIVSYKKEDLKKTIIDNYRNINELINDYIDIIHLEKHEDIFIKYVEFWTLMNKQKQLADKIDE